MHFFYCFLRVVWHRYIFFCYRALFSCHLCRCVLHHSIINRPNLKRSQNREEGCVTVYKESTVSHIVLMQRIILATLHFKSSLKSPRSHKITFLSSVTPQNCPEHSFIKYFLKRYSFYTPLLLVCKVTRQCYLCSVACEVSGPPTGERKHFQIFLHHSRGCQRQTDHVVFF